MKPNRAHKQWYRTVLGIIKIANMLAVFALMLAYLSAHVSPVKSVIPVFFGLSFPVWVLLNLFFVIFWVFRKSFFAIVPFVAIIAGAGHLKQMVGTGGKGEAMPDSTMKVLSYNTRLFDVYNYRANNGANNHEKIYRFLEEQQADIICLQEFYTEDTEELNVLDALLKVQPAKNYHVDYFQTRRKDYHWGIATFTVYPVLNRQRHQFRNSTGNYCIYTDIEYKNDTLRVFNTHLESWHFEKNDYRFLKGTDPPAEEDLSMNLKNIYWKIETAYLKRAVQIQELKELIKQSPYPVVVCGDFNDTPMSYTYHLMNKMLTDAFVEKGRGLGKTYRDGLPHFRIDYIFHDASFSTQGFTTHPVDYSDHYPISAILKFEGH